MGRTRWAILLLSMLALRTQGLARSHDPRVATAGQLIISEFRLHGAAGATDEFIEIYNASGASHTVAAASGTGYGIAASDGKTRCTIPNGTVIPDRGHFLCANSTGYSLGSYPAGSGTSVPDATYTLDIHDNAGIAVFNNNSGGSEYFIKNRLDAAGPTSETNTTYREGAGYPAVSVIGSDESFTRRPAGGCTGSIFGNCGSAIAMQTTAGTGTTPADSDDNARDFIFVDNSGSDAGAGRRLGAPGPENSSSPISLDGSIDVPSSAVDVCATRFADPNVNRDPASDGPNNSTYGTLDLRRTWTNHSGASLTRLRFRIVDMSTFPSAAGVADLRARTSGDELVPVSGSPCSTVHSVVRLVKGTTLETPAPQPFGGGYNSTLSVTSVASATPLADGMSISVHFLLGIQQKGIARFCVIPETLPASVGQPFCFIGNTEAPISPVLGDADFDQVGDMIFYNPATAQWRILESSGGFTRQVLITWGNPGDVPVPGDYDGDGRLDLAVRNEWAASWSILTSSSNYTLSMSFILGGPGYLPELGDYDGDGVTDLSVVEMGNTGSGFAGVWIVQTSSTGFSRIEIGVGLPVGNGYTPVPWQDFDGDRRTDPVMYSESTGTWVYLTSSTKFAAVVRRSWGGPGYTVVAGDYDGDGRSDFAVYNRMTGDWNILKSAGDYTSALTVGWGGPGYQPVPADYDGDGRIDVAVYQPETTKLLVLKSSTGYTTSFQRTVGAPGDLPLSTAVVPSWTREQHASDADGDYVSDLTVYNTSSGQWSTTTGHSGFSSSRRISWGGAGYTPVPNDYDGDGRVDLGVYQQSTGQWSVLRSSSNFTSTYSLNCGGAGYIPVAADYDGDGRTDLVVYNTASGLWYGLLSSTNFTTTINKSWGGAGYTAAPGDFDGDGKADLAVYQESSGNWLVLRSSTNYTLSTTRNLGGSGYAPVQADYDGDGITDFAVYQAATGSWSMVKSSAGNALGSTISLGGADYTPVAGDWDGDGHADLAVYRAATGQWSLLLSTGGYTVAMNKVWGGNAGDVPVPQFP